MNAPAATAPVPPRVAHLHSRREWGEAEARLLALVRDQQAAGAFAVLVAPAAGELFARARRAGLRVIPLEPGFRARRQLALELGEFDLTRLQAHGPEVLPLAQWLARRLKGAVLDT